MQEFAAVFLALLGDARRDDSIHGKRRLRRIAARGKRLVTRPQKSSFVKPPLRFREHDIRRDQSLVTGVVALGQRHHGTHAREHGFPPRLPAGLHEVRRGLVAVVAMRHAADEGIFIRLLRQHGHQFADADAGNIGLQRRPQLTGVIHPRLRLGIERVDMRRPTPEPDLNHRLGPGGFRSGKSTK